MKKNLILVPFIAILLLASACVITTEEDSSLTIQNESSFALTSIQFAGEFDTFYSDDVLRGDILRPAEAITVLLDCGVYDVLVSDETGAECEFLGFDLCFDDDLWILTDADFISCGF